MSTRTTAQHAGPTEAVGDVVLDGLVAGYGPVTAETARLLAMDGIWRRVVTDPLSGAVLDVGRARYRPPAELAEHVRSRDRTCVRAGCSADARGCDLDHTEEWGDGGVTSDANLDPLCGRDHQVKTDGGFRLVQTAPGEFRWVTPTGHTYEVRPGVSPARRHRPPLPDPDEPPF